MIVNIFDIHGGKIVINPNCLLIPELKTINESYQDPIPAFCYIHYMTHPKSPYANLEELEKEQLILEDYPGDYTPEEEIIHLATTKLRKLYETPTMRLLRNAKIGLENLSSYIGTAKISEGRDGNITPFQMTLSKIGKIAQEFRMLEKQVDDELGSIRGNADTGYDEL
jgi:hypothetical protein